MDELEIRERLAVIVEENSFDETSSRTLANDLDLIIDELSDGPLAVLNAYADPQVVDLFLENCLKNGDSMSSTDCGDSLLPFAMELSFLSPEEKEVALVILEKTRDELEEKFSLRMNM